MSCCCQFLFSGMDVDFYYFSLLLHILFAIHALTRFHHRRIEKYIVSPRRGSSSCLRIGTCQVKNMLTRSNEFRKKVTTKWKDDGIRERPKKGVESYPTASRANSYKTKKVPYPQESAGIDRKKTLQRDIAKKTMESKKAHKDPDYACDKINLLSRGLNYIPT